MTLDEAVKWLRHHVGDLRSSARVLRESPWGAKLADTAAAVDRAADKGTLAIAAIEAARADAWQPIETAPKDGTTVIGFWCGSRGTVGVVNGTNYGITAFNPDSGEWYDASEAGNEDDELARPDFWRPLPAPPAIDRARGVAQSVLLRDQEGGLSDE